MEAPIFIADLELTEPIASIALPTRNDGLAYNGVRLLVRMQHIPVGYVFLPPDSLDPATVASQICLEVAAVINSHRIRA